MTKKVFDQIMEGAQAALAIARGEAKEGEYRIHVPETVNVKKLRADLNLSQAEFCARYGFKIDRVQDWEQGRSRPDGALRAYLMVIQRQRHAVDKALAPPARQVQGRRKKSRQAA